MGCIGNVATDEEREERLKDAVMASYELWNALYDLGLDSMKRLGGRDYERISYMGAMASGINKRLRALREE